MASLLQQALDIYVSVQTRISNGGDPASKPILLDLAVAGQLVCQNAMGATPSVDTPDATAIAVDVPTNSPASDQQQ